MKFFFTVSLILGLCLSSSAVFASGDKYAGHWNDLKKQVKLIQKGPYKEFSLVTKNRTYLANELEDKGAFVVLRYNTQRKHVKSGKMIFEEYYVLKSSVIGLSYKVLR